MLLAKGPQLQEAIASSIDDSGSLEEGRRRRKKKGIMGPSLISSHHGLNITLGDGGQEKGTAPHVMLMYMGLIFL